MIDTPHGSRALTSAAPSPGQASRTISQTEGSAARCRVFRGQKLKLLKGDKLVSAQPHQEYTKASSSLTFQYSASSSADCVFTSVNTTRQTDLAAQVSIRNTVSHLHYLERKIKLINSKVDSFRPQLENAYSRLCCKIDTYTDNLNRRVTTLRSKGIRGDELNNKIEFLNARKNSYTEDLKRRTDLLNAKKSAYYSDLLRHLDLLNSNLDLFKQKLDMYIYLIQSKIDSFIMDIREKTTNLRVRYDSYIKAFSEEFRDVDIFRCNCAQSGLLPCVCLIPLGENAQSFS